jgi:hypothetical protein
METELYLLSGVLFFAVAAFGAFVSTKKIRTATFPFILPVSPGFLPAGFSPAFGAPRTLSVAGASSLSAFTVPVASAGFAPASQQHADKARFSSGG